MKPRLLLADDQRLFLEALRKLLESDFDVVGSAEDGRELVEAAASLQPDVILMDLSMPELNGIEAARQLRKLSRRSRLVFVTMHSDLDYVHEAFRAGASAYVLKTSAASELMTAIHEVLQGRTYLTSLLPYASISGGSKRPNGLTPRQREVLQLIAEGKSNRQIATILDVSIKTIEFHKASLKTTLGLHSTAELTRYAIAHGIAGR